MAQSTTTIESVWAAKGNLPDNAIVATADGKYPALDGSLITNVGAGDLLAANNLSELTATASVARTNLELGPTDTVEFGALVPPTGTTAEIDAVFSGSLAVVDAIYFDREKQQEWQALTNSTRQLVSGKISSAASYFINNGSGNDSTGKLNDSRLPFATIKGAFDAWEADSPSFTVVNFHIAGASVYDELNVLQNISSHATKTVYIICEKGVLFGATSPGVVFDNSSANCLFAGIYGYPQAIGSNQAQLYKGLGLPTTNTGGSVFELGYAKLSLTANIFEITGGRATVRADRIDLSISNASLVNTSGGAKVLIEVNSVVSTGSFSGRVVSLDGSSHVNIVNCSADNTAWARMLDSTSKVVINNCAYKDPAFGSYNCVTAAVSNANVYFLGTNGAVDDVDANVTKVTTFGSLVLNAAADHLIF